MPLTRLANGARLISPGSDGAGRQFAQAGNFTVEWIESDDGPRPVASGQELLVVFHGGGGTLAGVYGSIKAEPDSLALLPAGQHLLTVSTGGMAVVLATHRPDLDLGMAINAGDVRDRRIAPVGAPYERKTPLEAPFVTKIGDIPLPEDNKRLRFFQSATMSINLVGYNGPRDRTALSPHKHADIEQGTLALRGHYVHHLRLPWGKDANEWMDDAHVDAGPKSILLIPPELIHTTEGVGDEPHFMLDVFAPPRRDFRDKGWIANAADYVPPAAGSAS